MSSVVVLAGSWLSSASLQFVLDFNRSAESLC